MLTLRPTEQSRALLDLVAREVRPGGCAAQARQGFCARGAGVVTGPSVQRESTTNPQRKRRPEDRWGRPQLYNRDI